MNVLLASVLERTREVGIRKAMGARRRDILIQFLFESIFLSGSGGMIGIIVGILISRVLCAFIDIPSLISVEAITLGAVFAIGVGLIFGVYPAWKAASIDPIEALRYE
jgi:putative ABC transport system permease protein